MALNVRLAIARNETHAALEPREQACETPPGNTVDRRRDTGTSGASHCGLRSALARLAVFGHRFSPDRLADSADGLPETKPHQIRRDWTFRSTWQPRPAITRAHT